MALWLYSYGSRNDCWILYHPLTYDLSFDICKNIFFFLFIAKVSFATKNHFPSSVNMLFQLFYFFAFFYPFLTPLYSTFFPFTGNPTLYTKTIKKNCQQKTASRNEIFSNKSCLNFMRKLSTALNSCCYYWLGWLLLLPPYIATGVFLYDIIQATIIVLL